MTLQAAGIKHLVFCADGNRVRDQGCNRLATHCRSVTIQLAEAICINGIVMVCVNNYRLACVRCIFIVSGYEEQRTFNNQGEHLKITQHIFHFCIDHFCNSASQALTSNNNSLYEVLINFDKCAPAGSAQSTGCVKNSYTGPQQCINSTMLSALPAARRPRMVELHRSSMAEQHEQQKIPRQRTKVKRST